MKLSFAGLVVVTVGAALSIGCGPGLSHQGKWAKAPSAPAEIAATTTITSAPMQSQLPLAQWEEADAPPQPALQTWGAPPEIDPEYGF